MSKKTINLDAVEMLLEYKKILEQKVLDLRAEACVCASKVRLIKKAISDEQLTELEEKKKVDDAWSFKLQPHLQAKPQPKLDDTNLMNLVQNGK